MLNPSATFGVVIFGSVWAARVQAERAAAAANTKGCIGRGFMSESLYRMRPGPLRRDARLHWIAPFFRLTPMLSRCSFKYLAHVCSHSGACRSRKQAKSHAWRRKTKTGAESVPAGKKGQRLVLNSKRR